MGDVVEVAKLPIKEFINEFADHLALKGFRPSFVDDTRKKIVRIFAKCEFEVVGDMRGDRVSKWLGAFGKRHAAGTTNQHRFAVCSFGEWMHAKKGVVNSNPFKDISIGSGGRVLERRVLSQAELSKLLKTTLTCSLNSNSKVKFGAKKGQVAKLDEQAKAKWMKMGRERVLIYKMALYAGLRRNEILNIRVNRLSFGDRPKVDLPGTFIQNGDRALLPLRDDLAQALEDWIRDEGLREHDKLFQASAKLVDFLKKDLEAAGIPYKDEQGRVFDFQSFRMCFFTFLRRSGVPITIAQGLMRDSSVDLSTKTYNVCEQYDVRDAVNRLPSF